MPFVYLCKDQLAVHSHCQSTKRCPKALSFAAPLCDARERAISMPLRTEMVKLSTRDVRPRARCLWPHQSSQMIRWPQTLLRPSRQNLPDRDILNQFTASPCILYQSPVPSVPWLVEQAHLQQRTSTAVIDDQVLPGTSSAEHQRPLSARMSSISVVSSST